MTTRAKHAELTRDRILASARALFAERGFYGVSTAHVSENLGMSKQGVLHYFATKEKLYSMVLKQIACELAELRPDPGVFGDPAQRITEYFVAMIADTPPKVERSRLLMREILDNRARAEAAGVWHLKPFLEDLTTMLRAVPAWSEASEDRVLAAIIQLLGAVDYHAVSGPTFRGIFGKESMAKADAAFEKQLRLTIGAVLKAGHPV